MSLGGVGFGGGGKLDCTHFRRVSLVVFRVRFVAVNLRVFLALPMLLLSSKTREVKMNKILIWKWNLELRRIFFSDHARAAVP
jgi:hypothetical protein